MIFDPGGWHTFGPIKWTAITVLAWLSLATMAWRGFHVHRLSLLGWIVLLLWGVVTSAVAVDPLSAWVGTPDRRFGTVALFTLGAAFVAGQGITDSAGRRLLSRAAVVALLGMSLYGVAEAAGWTVRLTTTAPRLGSTFGSAAYLGAGLCLFAPMAAGVLGDGNEQRGWRVMGAMALAGAAFLLVGSGTRAALLGLAVAVVVSARIWLPATGRHLAVVGAAAAALVLVLFLYPGAGRLLQPDAEGRLAEWRVAISTLAAHPATGAGLEGYRVVFPRQVDVEYVRRYGRSTVTDRAHSGPLDAGVSLGVPGAAAWLVAAVWLTRRGWEAMDRRDPVLSGLAAGVVALLAQELFLFPTLEVGAAGWAVAGAVVAARPASSGIAVRSGVVALAALALAVGAAVAGVADVAADHLAASARARGDVATADRAASLRPDSFRYPLLGADIALRSGAAPAAETRIDTALRLAPADPALRLARARVTASLVSDGITAPEEGARRLERLVEQDPNHPELRLIHGDLLARAGFAAEAERTWLAAAHLSPGDAEAELRLASLYLSLGEIDLARTALERAREREPDHPALASLEQELEDA